MKCEICGKDIHEQVVCLEHISGALAGGLGAEPKEAAAAEAFGPGSQLHRMVRNADNVDHPKHYNIGSIEVIDVLEDWQLGFHEANAVKYIARAKHKNNELEDLKKARWYLNRRIEKLESK